MGLLWGDGRETRWLWAPGGFRRGSEGRCCPTLAGRAAASGRGERVAAARRLTGPATTGHEASKAGTHITGLSGIRELLAAQVGLP